MVRYTCLLVALVVAATPLITSAAEPTPAGRQILMKIRAYEGDPQGSAELGTLKVLAAPTIVTLEGRSAFFHAGGEVALVDHPAGQADYARFGTTLECKPGFIRDGKVRLDLHLTTSNVVDANVKPVAVRSESLRTVIDAKLGETITIGKVKHGSNQSWCEITVDEMANNADATRLLKQRR